MSGHDHVKDSSDDITTELTSYNTTFYVFLVVFSLLMMASSAYVNKTFHLVPSRQLAKRWQPTSKLQEVVMLDTDICCFVWDGQVCGSKTK
ncbi:hypothetical protein AX774_g4063 [Zancudomyces culisetae]|uniref:Uncharacterized protein n=1 Tax=Zancudomyces culisetae TaxID=1213189 RepID=A0A1R1PNB2_ZANCU|nr:hypothetical protein AX774_g4063 [Zancudomyces culisetae]|eukprot:OMH82448.1 hypothetical protein AX774_g4063 [Zancudomyces culisetae]